VIHPAAHVHPDAVVPPDAEIGPGAVVDAHVQLGARCRVQAHAVLTGWTILGDDCVVGFGAVIGGDPQDLAFDRATVSRVRIGHRCVLREHSTVHRGTKPDTETLLGDDCFLMAGAHVAHNCRVGNGVILANNVLLAGYAEVGDRCFLGGGAVVHQFTRVGRLALMQGISGISQDLPPFCIAAQVNELAGLNTVGLRRAGVAPAARLALRAAYHAVFRADGFRRERIAALRAEATVPEVVEFLDFIAGAKRGVVQPPAAAVADADE
jgi:UDP-N-acetylglucosamine acyltransferase